MRSFLIAAGVSLSAAVLAQDALPAFDVASVKRNDSGSGASTCCMTGGKFVATNVTVIQLLRPAYGVQEFQIANQPGWAGFDRFDVMANLPDGSKPDQWTAMLQQLLSERFGLRLHREQRQTDAYALVVANSGFTLMPVEASRCAPPDTGGAGGNAGARCGMSATPTEIVARGQSMEQLATRLSRSIGQTVVDRTGVKGQFDFTLRWTQDDQFRAPGASASPAIFTALSEQLGLRLQSQRVPIEVLVIDRLEQPTPD